MNDWKAEEERWENAGFVGREAEREQFRAWLRDPDRRARLLNVYGIGGIGKSRLLRICGTLARLEGAMFVLIDFRDMASSPDAFENHLRHLLSSEADKMDDTLNRPLSSEDGQPEDTLNRLAARTRIVLALDSYERAASIDGWLRDSFIPRLDSDILLVIAGRYELDGGWLRSAYWRGQTAKLELEGFSEAEVGRFVAVHRGEEDEAFAAKAYVWSGGLPLTLSLLPLGASAWQRRPDLAELSGHWLWETADEALRARMEYASSARVFNQELLGSMYGAAVTDAEFEALVKLSFVSSTRRGWYIQEGVREAIRASFRKSKPAAYRDSLRACTSYYLELLKEASEEERGWVLQELLYYLTDSLPRSVLAVASAASENRMESLNEANYPEVCAFLEARRAFPRLKRNRYYDQEKDVVYTLEMTQRQDERRAQLVDPADWLALGLDSVKLMRDKAGRPVGLLAVIPIHRNTLEMLATRPVTRAYFAALSLDERLQLAVSPERPAGWFIRMIDVADPGDAKARAELVHAAMGYVAAGGRILVTTHLPFYQELLRRLGFEEVPGAEHVDYGADSPAPTYLLDLSGTRLIAWLGRISPAGLPQEDGEEEPDLRLTEREKDIARLLLQGYSNPEISRTLFLSEITVKKYVSQMLAKAGCKNRTQLTQVLLKLRSLEL